VGTERGGIYGLLRISAAYDLLQRLLGSKRWLEIFVNDYIRPFPGASVLDIGAGTGSIFAQLGDVSYFGIEPNQRYVDDFNAVYLTEKVRLVQGTTETVEVSSEKFDIVLISAVLHHITDSQVHQILDFARNALRPSGRIVVLDPVFHRGQHPIARFLARRDRGRFVREFGDYQSLFDSHALAANFEVRTDMLSVPYSHVLTQATKATSTALS
jgi:SAM-dependent methyltransferase